MYYEQLDIGLIGQRLGDATFPFCFLGQPFALCVAIALFLFYFWRWGALGREKISSIARPIYNRHGPATLLCVIGFLVF